MDALTDRKNILKDALAAIEDLQSRLEAAEGARNEPIAIVGMSFRFPGGADASEKFWAILRGGVNAIREVPPDRWDIDSYYDPDPEVEGEGTRATAAFSTASINSTRAFRHRSGKP